MKRTFLGVLVLLLAATSASAGTVKEIPLQKGRRSDNNLKSAVISPNAPIEIGEFVQGFPAESRMHRIKSGGAAGGKSKASPDLDLGVVLTEALRGEAERMGFEIGEGGWKIEGTLRAFFYDVRANAWMAFFFGTTVVNVEIVSPDGEVRNETYHLFNFHPEARKLPAILAEVFVESSQELLARLNVRHFGFPPDPSVKDLMAEISAKGMSGRRPECYAVGLSGSSEFVEPLLEVLERTKDEDDRVYVVEALARLEDAKAIPLLRERYASEDADVRWFTFKAMSYIGTEDALTLAIDNGPDDENKASRQLSLDIADLANLVQPAHDVKYE